MPSEIPAITHRLGRYWEQPDRDEIAVDDRHALMTRTTFRKLAHYEISLPSGVYAGKMWRRGDLLCWYADAPGKPDVCNIEQRDILILE